MAKSELITAARLRELVYYDEENGTLVWSVLKSPTAQTGMVSGCARKDGRIVIRIDGRLYLKSRLVWLYVNGEWPPRGLDHTDLDTSNDRRANLRLATQSQNCANFGKKRNNTSGFKGVSWHSASRKWRAQIMVSRRQIYLGLHNTKDAAHAAYCAAAKNHFGEFWRG